MNRSEIRRGLWLGAALIAAIVGSSLLLQWLLPEPKRADETCICLTQTGGCQCR